MLSRLCRISGWYRLTPASSLSHDLFVKPDSDSAQHTAINDELCDSTACPYEESGLAIIFFFCQVFEEEGCAAKFDSNPTILGAASVCSAPVYPQCLEVFLPPAP